MAKYRIGLDVGTNSIGWAVTDLNNKLIMKKGKKLLGVLMFEESSGGDKDPNKLRRTYRCSRRRIRRRKERLNYLNEIFAPEINKIDPTFFERLDESFLKLEDRKYKDKYTLFIDKNFNDKTYFKKFNTIYHLQKYLMESEKKEDIRLIYLAIRHLIKYRGNFLNSSNPDNYSSKIDELDFLERLTRVFEIINSYEIYSKFNKPILDINDIKSLIKANKDSKGINSKKENFIKIFNKEEKKNNLIDFVASLLAGSSVELNKILKKGEDGPQNSIKISFTDDLTEKFLELRSEYPEYDDFISSIEDLYRLYQALYINKYVQNSLPQTMVERFNTYKTDLKLLKGYIRKYYSTKYDEVFNSIENKMSYPHLVRHYCSDIDKKTKVNISNDKSFSRIEFINYLKNEFSFDQDDELTLKLKERINSDDFLLTQSDKGNGNFPYQLNYFVLKKIIINQEKFYSFFDEKDSNGYVNKDKIISLLTFKIPYYIGPLSNNYDESDENNHAWIIRKKEGHIRPWNFDEIVNVEDSAKKFIQRMQNKCTYLINEYCLPKDSITFQKYLVYQQLNTLYVNGKFYFNSDNKDDLIINLYSKNRKITKKLLQDYLSNKLKEKVVITYKNGKDKDVEPNLHSLSSLFDFIKVFGSYEEVDKNIDLIENIIRDIAIFEDKSILASRLENEYKLNKDQIRIIKSFNYNKFSRLSKKLLDGIKPVDKNGVLINKTILTILKDYDGSENKPATLMEILNSKDSEYDFDSVIKIENSKEEENESVDSFIENSYLPKISKRPTILTCRIIEELAHALKANISEDFEFYIECARTNKSDKKATKTRYEKLMETLSKSGLKSQVDSLINELKKYENDKSKLNAESLYLYFMQLGKDMYTGDQIDLNTIIENYDVDHIIPRSLIKNDSLDNKVLTEKKFNNGKSNIYPLSKIDLWEYNGGRKKALEFYKKLKDNNLISERKYIALTANTDLDNDTLEGFANKQLSTTNQSVIGLKEVFEDYYSINSENIILSKAENVSDFRNNFDLVKSRTANNFHHAHDAYLNIFVGSAVNSWIKNIFKLWRIDESNEHKYSDFVSFVREKRYTLNPIKIMEKYVKDQSDEFNELKDVIYNYKFIFTKTRTYIKKDFFPKSTVYAANSCANINTKNNLDCKKYGGFKEYAFGYYVLIKTKDNKFILEPVPYVFNKNVSKYLDNLYKKNYEIYLDNVKINTKFQIEKRQFIITGKTGSSYVVKNSIERYFPYYLIKIIKKVDNFMIFLKLNKIGINVEKQESINKAIDNLNDLHKIKDINNELISKENKIGEIETLTTNELINVFDYLFELYNKDVFSFSFSKTLIDEQVELKNKFIHLNILLQTYTISEMLDYLKTNERKDINLISLGGKGQCGIIKINKVLPIGAKIIFESNTGLYKKEISLK